VHSRIRISAASASIGIMFGAISVLALTQGESRQHGREEPATAGAAAPAADDTSAMAPITAGAVHTRSPCENWLDSFLDRECESGKSREPRSRRDAPHRSVSLPIGRSGAILADEPTAPQPDAATGDKAVANAAPGASDAPATHTKSQTRRARKHRQPTWSPGGSGLDAFAAAPWFDGGAYNREAAPFAGRGRGPPR
jgi:hypothetical protein